MLLYVINSQIIIIIIIIVIIITFFSPLSTETEALKIGNLDIVSMVELAVLLM